MIGVVHPQVEVLIRELTNEHPGDVFAWVYVHGNVLRGKFAIFREERLFLAVLEAQFAIILDIGFLNIREMIFMYDQEKMPHTELPVHLAALVNDL